MAKKASKKRKREKSEDEEHDDYNHYDELDMNTIFNTKMQFRGVMKKYWVQRNTLFDRYDDGIILTKELWFSVTPESVSRFIANFLLKSLEQGKEKVVLLDAFCGGGGNVIQFLKLSETAVVYGVDINKIHLDCTLNNCHVYQCADLDQRLKLLPLDWEVRQGAQETATEATTSESGAADDVQHDAETYADREDSVASLKVLNGIDFDCVFASPPWGGPEYIRAEVFDLNNLQPFGLEELLLHMRAYSNNIVLFLPKNSDLEQLQEISKRVFKDLATIDIRIIHLCVGNGREKGLLSCWGDRFSTTDISTVQLIGGSP